MSSCTLLQRNDSARTDFWVGLLDLFHRGQFCDLEIVCQGAKIRCHRLVVASASSLLRSLLTDDSVIDSEDVTVVHLPDHNGRAVKAVVEGIYGLAVARFVAASFWKTRASLGDLFDFGPSTVEVKADPGVEVREEHFVDCKEDVSIGEVCLGFGLTGEPLGRKRKRATETKERQATRPREHDTEKKSLEQNSSKAEPKKKRIRKPKKEQKSILKFDDPPDSPSAELYNLMKNANTTLNIRLLAERLDVEIHLNKRNRERSHFQVLVGLAKTDRSPRQFKAKPLAWSLPDSDDVTSQFDSVFDAFRELYGFSDGDMYYNSLLFSKQGLCQKNRSSNRRFELRGEFANLFPDELSKHLADETFFA